MADMCPHTQGLKCDIFYRFDECYSQGEKVHGVLFKKIRCSCEPAVCEANPELCERYQKHMRQLQKTQEEQLVHAK